jgi:hypothetical protein
MERACSRQGRKRNEYRVLVEKSGRKRPLEISRRRWKIMLR